MKLMQRIMSRSLLLILILAAVIAYFYRDQLFPGQDEQLAETASTASDPGNGTDQAAADADRGRADKGGSADPVAGTQSDSGAMQADARSDGTASREAAVSAESAQPSGELADVQPPVLKPDVDRDAGTEPEPDQDSAGEETAAAETPDQNTTVAVPAEAPVYRPEAPEENQAEIENLLRQARTAYWAGDTGGAESAYRRVLQTDRSDPDPAGELGNMLYSQGDFAGAADAYYQAAVRLLEQGEYQRVRYMARVIAGFDSDKAAQLEAQLNRHGGEDEAGEVN